MKLKLEHILAIIGVLSIWVPKSLLDGKISLNEALSLIMMIAESLDLPLGFDANNIQPKPESETTTEEDGNQEWVEIIEKPRTPIQE